MRESKHKTKYIQKDTHRGTYKTVYLTICKRKQRMHNLTLLTLMGI